MCILAMKIQYNINSIEEWCKSHNMPEGTLQLEHLMQATKLLQLKKVRESDNHGLIPYLTIISRPPRLILKLFTTYAGC